MLSTHHLCKIGFVKDAKKLKPIILDSSKYEEATNYSMKKETIYCFSFYEFVLFILWIGFGLAYLDSLLQIDSYWLKAIIFVDSFIVINWFYLYLLSYILL